jgi:hypothetical protein
MDEYLDFCRRINFYAANPVKAEKAASILS